MSARPASPVETLAIVGGGFSGTFLALKMAERRPDLRIVLIEPRVRAGSGLAYGTCQPIHLLNVPVHRMDLPLDPPFSRWLGHCRGLLGPALAEAGGDMAQAFAPRELFGAYLEERLRAALSADGERGLQRLHGEVAAVDGEGPRHAVRLADGRVLAADRVVLATGNLPPRPPRLADDWLYRSPVFVEDPWRADPFASLDRAAPVLLVGTGLTMVDVALTLAARGHRGPIRAVSRRGQLPRAHRAGGRWEPFIDVGTGRSPLQLLRLVRERAEAALAQGVPWQRVMDAVRPAVAGIWAGWTLRQRAQFLRHLRPLWDVHRHRMAVPIADGLDGLIASGQLVALAGRIPSYRPGGAGAFARLLPRGGGEAVEIEAACVVNCTGPRSDLRDLDSPLFASLLGQGLIAPDALGLGLETEECAVLDAHGAVSSWLYALGPLTRPAWWEVVAVPEIAAQVLRLVETLAPQARSARPARATPEAFSDLGSGI